MRLNILTRLLLGYFMILIGSSLISGFLIYKLRDFSLEANQVLILENRLQDYTKKLTEALLSQMRYEKKFAVLQDQMLYNQFIVAKGDFLQNLLEVQSLPSSITEKNSLSDIREKFDRYEALVENELKSPRGKKRESTEGSREKEELINGIFNQLNELKETSKENNLRRFRELGQAQEASMNFIIYVGAGTLGLIILISLIITRGITRPISQLVGKTREMAEGTYRGDLKIKSPPEVARLNQAFNEMCEQLNKVDKMKSDFFSIMSHELRTPLTSIREGTNLLLEGVGGHLNEKQEKLIGIVSEESSRLIELVNSLLDLAKMEAGMMPFNFSQVEITPVITLAAQLLEPLLITKNIKLHLEVPAALPAIRLDSERMLQAIKNLLANAIKFSPDGGTIRLSLQNRPGFLEVAVGDQGPGIPRDQWKKIFEKFRQVELPGRSSVKGTGLGLAIVQQIVTAHGGKVWVESEIGKGSTFFFALPR